MGAERTSSHFLFYPILAHFLFLWPLSSGSQGSCSWLLMSGTSWSPWMGTNSSVPVAGEEGAWSSGCVCGPKSWGEGIGPQGDCECPTWGRLFNVPPFLLTGLMDAPVILSFFFSSAILLPYHLLRRNSKVSSHDRNHISPLLQEALLTFFFGLHRAMILGSVNAVRQHLPNDFLKVAHSVRWRKMFPGKFRKLCILHPANWGFIVA